MGRKKLNDPMVRISFQLPKSHLAHLENLCYEMSYKEKKKFTISYLIRETLSQAYPMPQKEQLDLFGKK